MLEVAFITDSPRVAGSEIWLLERLPRLPFLGLHPTLFLPKRPNLDGFAEVLEGKGVKIQRYASLREVLEATASYSLRVFQGWKETTYYLLFPRLAHPKVAVVHEQLDYRYPAGLRQTYHLLYRLGKGSALKGADRVLTVSQWAARFLRGMGLEAEAVPNGVDPDRFRPPDPEERASLRKAYGLHRFTVLVPGRFAPEKNQLAALFTAQRVPEVDFLFAGDDDSPLGALSRGLKGILGLGNVRFLGRREDMPELYRAADAVLLPTLGENQSLATLEAMASGLPVVTTPIPAQEELIQNGVTGLLVPPRPHLLAQALRTLARDPHLAHGLGQAARQKVLAHHTLEESIRRLARALEEVRYPCASTA